MSPRLVTLVILFIASEAVGILFGEWFFRLYVKAVPPMALSSFNTEASRIAHLLYGAGVGLALFVWALLGMTVDRLLRLGSRTKAPAPPPPGSPAPGPPTGP